MSSLPLYPIGIVAEILAVHPETLRVWDRESLVQPSRRRGMRCYSDADLLRLLFVKHLLDEEGFNLAGVRGYIRLYHCWSVDDCGPCQKAIAEDNGKPCWKRPGMYCGLAVDESLLCTGCSQRRNAETTLPFALQQLTGLATKDALTPGARGVSGQNK